MDATRKGTRGAGMLLVLGLAGSLAACGSEAPSRRPDARALVGTMITHLADDDFTVRRNAARALGRIGPVAKEALPVLTCALGDPAAQVRDAARMAIGRIEGRTP